MTKKLTALFLVMVLGVSCVLIAHADDNTKKGTVVPDANYYAAVEELAAGGVTACSSSCLTQSKGMQLPIEVGMLENHGLTLSQLSAQAPIRLQEQLARQAEEAAARAQEEAEEGVRDVLLEKYDGVMICCDDALNMRKTPGGDVVRMIAAGKVAHLNDISGNWYQITFGEKTGYVSADYCKLVSYADYEGTAATSTLREDIIAFAETYLGTPYSYGGTSYSGIDCSGFTMKVFEHFGISLSHGVTEQYYRAQHISTSELEPGDIVVFYTGSDPFGHIGIYAGGGSFIHASCSQGVTYSSLGDSYYASRYYAAGRLINE